MNIKYVCSVCHDESLIRPRDRNETCNTCGQGRRRAFIRCPVCQIWFKTDHYNQQCCSIKCLSSLRTTGRTCTRKTIREARNAQSLLAYHISKGHIQRPISCQKCGKTGERIEASHDDYSQPLKVRWLCRSCHVKWDYAHPKNVTYRVALPSAL